MRAIVDTTYENEIIPALHVIPGRSDADFFPDMATPSGQAEEAGIRAATEAHVAAELNKLFCDHVETTATAPVPSLHLVARS